jgi:type VI secretion system secreted protein VgrG
LSGTLSGGLSYHFERLDADAAQAADERSQARHSLVISDAAAARADLGPTRFSHQVSQPSGDNPSLQHDTITAFTARRRVAANAVALGAWYYTRVSGSAAQDSSALPLG